jgi:Na+/melibiose symporter-like transporter
MMGALFFLSFYLQSVRGYTPLKAGAFSLAFAVAQMLTAPRSPALVRRFGAKWVVASGLLLVTAALISYQLLNVATPIWVLAVAFFIQGAGMGLVMPPATEAVMSVVPRERAGAGSALTNTARQVSGALGVAVLGSILAQAYRNELAPHLGALPAPARNAATSSITASQAVAARLGPAGRDLAAFADTSFVHAMHLTTLISAAITLLGALIVIRWMPGRARAGAPRQATGIAIGQGAAAGSAGEAALVKEAVPASGIVAVPGNGAVLVGEAAPAAEAAAQGPGGPAVREE